METSILRSFLDGTCDARTLAKDLEGGVTRTSYDVISQCIDDDLDGKSLVTAAHLVVICDAFMNGDLTAQMVEQIAFALEACDCFDWDCSTSDGVRAAEVIGCGIHRRSITPSLIRP